MAGSRAIFGKQRWGGFPVRAAVTVPVSARNSTTKGPADGIKLHSIQRTHLMTALLLLFGIGSFLASQASAQDIDRARQEGRLVFYTSWGATDADYVIKAFEKKYPFLKVEIVRSTSEKTLNRLLRSEERRVG